MLNAKQQQENFDKNNELINYWVRLNRHYFIIIGAKNFLKRFKFKNFINFIKYKIDCLTIFLEPQIKIK